jgi:hypothetical protein
MTFLQESIWLVRFRPHLFDRFESPAFVPTAGAAGSSNFQLARAEFSN